VVGPVASVQQAPALVEREADRLDAAVLDVSLRNQRVFPVANALSRRGIPIVFCTGVRASSLGQGVRERALHQQADRRRRLVQLLSLAIAGSPRAPQP
jgi:hypothetical protein